METKILVDTQSKTSMNPVNLVTWTTQNIWVAVEALLIERNSSDKNISLNWLKDISNISELWIYIKNGKSIHKIKISQEVMEWIKDFLKNDYWNTSEDQDCFYFARILMGEKRHHEWGFNASRYKIGFDLFSKRLKSWDVLQIHELDESWELLEGDWTSFSHFAIYLWEWFFISKCGGWNWNIIITTLEKLQELYPYNTAFYLKQRRMQRLIKLLTKKKDPSK